MNTYAITANGKTHYVIASSRKAACMKFIGMSFKSAAAAGHIESAKKVTGWF